MNLTPAFNRPLPTWRDEILAVPVVALAIVVMVVLELWKWSVSMLKGMRETPYFNWMKK